MTHLGKAFTRTVLAALAFGICFGLSLAAEEPMRPHKRPRPEMRNPGLPNHMRWFLNLEDVTAEKERHRKAIAAIIKETPDFIKKTIRREKEGTPGGEKLDREALQKKIQAKLAEIGGKMIDEQIRHQKAMTALLETHRDDAIKFFQEKMKQRQMQRRNQRQNRAGKPGRGKSAEEFEGAIF